MKGHTVLIALAAISMLLIVAIIIFYFSIRMPRKTQTDEDCKFFKIPDDFEVEKFKLRTFENAAISSDTEECSILGSDILKRNGSAVDAAIVVLLCTSLYNPQSSGIGGGNIAVIYKKSTNRLYSIDARESAPARSNYNMFLNKSIEAAIRNGPAVGVPGEIYGFFEAHKIAGKLPWKELFQPIINLAENGIKVSKYVEIVLSFMESCLRNDDTLKGMYIDPVTDKPKRIGQIIKMPLLANTLRKLSEINNETLFDDHLTETIVEEINSKGGVFLKEDLKNYRPRVKPPIILKLKNGYKIATAQLPASGIISAFVIKLMDRYNYSDHMMNTVESQALFYHRFTEALKFGFAQRSLLEDGDPKSRIQVLTNDSFIDEIFMKINDNQTFEPTYYEFENLIPNDFGTTHVSIVAPNGDAVSISSSVNSAFGACFVGKHTGIIYNSQMLDFNIESLKNPFVASNSKLNSIAPNKRPLSSMSPMIIFDQNNKLKLVIGSSGGSKIISGVSLSVIKNIFLNMDIKESIDSLRVHHQLIPNILQVESKLKFPKELKKLLEEKGHKFDCLYIAGTIQEAVDIKENGKLDAYSDKRKGGVSAGF